MKNYSDKAKRELNSIEAGEGTVPLLTIEHPDLISPLRVCAWSEDIVSNGNTFQSLPFRVTPPDDISQGMPRARIEIDNVGQDLMEWLELSNGGTGAVVTLQEVLPSTPNTIEDEYADLTLRELRASPSLVTGNLTFDDLLGRPGVAIRHTPDRTPGIF